MYVLHIANKNYSSWSLRPWVLMRELGIPFTEQLTLFQDPGTNYAAFRAFSPNGKVPCLVDGDITVWESLAIAEYLADRHPAVWPAAPAARAWARCAAAEMHAGFATLRDLCPMNIGVRIRRQTMPEALVQDIARIGELWSEGLSRFAGPYLAGPRFTAADAFFAPIAFRIQTYGLDLPEPAAAYAARLLARPSMQAWYTAGLAETAREPGHEAETRAAGMWVEDLRAVAA